MDTQEYYLAFCTRHPPPLVTGQSRQKQSVLLNHSNPTKRPLKEFSLIEHTWFKQKYFVARVTIYGRPLLSAAAMNGKHQHVSHGPARQGSNSGRCQMFSHWWGAAREAVGTKQLSGLFGEQTLLTIARTNCFTEPEVANISFSSFPDESHTVIHLDNSGGLWRGGWYAKKLSCSNIQHSKLRVPLLLHLNTFNNSKQVRKPFVHTLKWKVAGITWYAKEC